MKRDHHAATPIPHTLQSQLLESSGYLIAMLGRESRRRYMAHVDRWEIGWQIGWQIGWPHQLVLGVLLHHGAAGAASQKELSDATEIDPRNLVAILDVLEARRLIERVPHPTDRRRSGIKFTSAGLQLALDLQAASAQVERDFLACLNQAEQETLHRLLLKLYRGIGGSEDGQPAE